MSTCVVAFLIAALTFITSLVSVHAAERFYNGGAGGTGVRELPLFVAKDFKLFDKYGLDVELIFTNGEIAVCFYCSLVEQLSVASMSLWSGCTRRLLDIAFESGAEPECQTYQLPEALVKRVSALGLGIAITIYRVGAYSDPSRE